MPTSSPLDDELLPLAVAAKLLPKNGQGKAPSIQSLRRWSKRGSHNVYLNVTFVGGRMFVSREALISFIEERNASPTSITRPSPTIATSRAVDRLIRKGA